MRGRVSRPGVWVLLLGALTGVALVSGLLSKGSAGRRPNVVLIVLDTLRADALGCYDPASSDVSPEIDALARRAVRFTHVTAQSSWTRPSVASLLTARYPRSLGIYREKWDTLDRQFPTLGQVLGENGYDTIGMTANPNLNRAFGFGWGFHTYVESDVVWRWMEHEHGERVRSRRNPLPDSDRMLRELVSWARARSSTTPAYMQIVLMEVHEGWALVRPEFRGDDRGRVGVPHGYWDGVRQLSHDVGGFIEDLTSLPGWRNTLFVVTSDHGQGLADHPGVERSWGHGHLLYESQVRVPLILYRPPTRGLRGFIERVRSRGRWELPPSEIDTRVRLMDLMPTILDYLEIPLPTGLEGRSLLPQMRADAPTDGGGQDYFVSETQYQGSRKIAVNTPQWRLIENRDDQAGVNPVELQATGGREDGIRTDQIGAEPAVARELRDYLRRWEERFPMRPASQPEDTLAVETIQQLKALGYVE